MIYTLEQSDLALLDKQEFCYNAITVNVKADTGEVIPCRTYVQDADYKAKGPSNPPSKVYKNIVVEGAKANNFPAYYQEILQNIEDNGREDCTLAYLVKPDAAK